MGNVYALELYSVRKELKKDLWGTLRKVKQMGYDGVEFFGEYAQTAQELAAALADTGLVCCGWHTPWPYVSPSHLMSTITYNRILGNKEIVIPGLAKEMTASKEACMETAKALEAVADKLAAYGMNLSYHNHADEFMAVDGDTPFHYLFDNTRQVGMQLDNGNAWMAGPETDIYDPVIRYSGRARSLHLKPFSIKAGFATMIGEDDIDWPRYFSLCYTYQPVDWFIVEYESEALYTPLEGAEKCLAALKQMEKDELI